MIKVLKPGFFTSVQDAGRIGGREFGVPNSGAMDAFSAQLANALLGNNLLEAVLEVTLTGPTLQFNCKTSICITGANMNPTINDRLVQLNRLVSVSTNDILSFGKLEIGCRSYIAVSGGFQTEKVMNSRSMYPNVTSKSNIETDDELQIMTNAKTPDNAYSSIKPNRALFHEITLKTLKGPEFDRLTAQQQHELTSREFTVSKNNNRMGYQLEEPFENNLKSIITAPVLPGTVQLTPSGKLIVLMRDGQTTGGYPRVLQLTESSINVLAQKKVGDSIRFQF